MGRLPRKRIKLNEEFDLFAIVNGRDELIVSGNRIFVYGSRMEAEKLTETMRGEKVKPIRVRVV